MEKENQLLAKRIREILKKKKKENRALLKLIRAMENDKIQFTNEK